MSHTARIASLLVAALAAVALLAGPAVAAGTATDLRADLVAIGGTRVQLTLTNEGGTSVAVPARLTGTHGIDDPILLVSRDGAPAAYAGMVAKRDDTAPGAAVTIGAGASGRWSLDVATAYALTAAGPYNVQYRVQMPDGPTVASNPVTITAAAGSALKTPGTGRPGAASLGYTGCNAGEQSALTTALGAANTYATTAVQYFAANRSGTRYQRWFGPYLSARWNAVSSHFTAIQAVTGNTSASFVCHDAGCTPGTYAFVYPGTPYAIYVCGGFWDAPLTGTDSRAGTFIHEISHFTAVASTADHVYGQTDAMALALSTPAQAVSNADNHEYFAENTAPVEYATYSTASGAYAFADTTAGGESGATSVTVTSAGDITLQPTGASVTGDFTITANTCTGATLAPGATCRIDVAFRPTAEGLRTGTLAVQGNLDLVPASVTLSGTGTSPPAPPAASAPIALPAPTVAAPAPTVVITPLQGNATCRARGACVVTGTLPAGATRVTVTATRPGGGSRGTCTAPTGSGARTYRCTIRLGPGTWAITTTAVGQSGAVATRTVNRKIAARR